MTIVAYDPETFVERRDYERRLADRRLSSEQLDDSRLDENDRRCLELRRSHQSRRVYD